MRRRLSHDEQCEFIARQFHDTYEALAPEFGFESRPTWPQTSPSHRGLMIEVAGVLLERGVIRCRVKEFKAKTGSNPEGRSLWVR